jgi:hypothetical protein
VRRREGRAGVEARETLGERSNSEPRLRGAPPLERR